MVKKKSKEQKHSQPAIVYMSLEVILCCSLHFRVPVTVVPKTIPRLSDVLGKLKPLSMLLYSWLWFIKVKRYKAKLAQGKGTCGKVQRK